MRPMTFLLPATALVFTMGLFACSNTVSPPGESDVAEAVGEDGLEPFIPGFDPGKYSSKADEPSSSASKDEAVSSGDQSAASGDEPSGAGDEGSVSGDDSSASSGEEPSGSGDEGSASGDESSSSAAGESSASTDKSGLDESTGEMNAGKDIMSGVDDATSTELNDLVTACTTAAGCPDGFEELEGSLVVDKDGSGNLTYDSFDENDYYCFSGEGSWLKLDRAKLGEYIPHFKNGAAWGNLSHFDIRFENLCSAVYIMRK